MDAHNSCKEKQERMSSLVFRPFRSFYSISRHGPLVRPLLRPSFTPNPAVMTISRSFQTPNKNNSNFDKETDETIDYGFRNVKKADKEKLVRHVFSTVATKYDLMNDLMSLGIHRWWKYEVLKTLAPFPGQDLLDVGGGTGDISFRFMEKVWSSSESNVVVCDINPEMLAVGKERAIQGMYVNMDGSKKDGHPSLDFVEANAEVLPFDDNSFDFYTIGFCIRNVTNRDKAIAEAFRVLRPGGRYVCLEFTPRLMMNKGGLKTLPVVGPFFDSFFIPALQKMYDFYSFNFLPPLGSLVTGNRDAYQYLVEGIRKFPKQEDFADLISSQGFVNVSCHNFNFGIAAMHSGFKPR